MKLYISAAKENLECLLARKNNEREEHAIYYLSRRLLDAEKYYSTIEKLCLALYYACTKLRYYI